jgi:hypothetical protein
MSRPSDSRGRPPSTRRIISTQSTSALLDAPSASDNATHRQHKGSAAISADPLGATATVSTGTSEGPAAVGAGPALVNVPAIGTSKQSKRPKATVEEVPNEGDRRDPPPHVYMQAPPMPPANKDKATERPSSVVSRSPSIPLPSSNSQRSSVRSTSSGVVLDPEDL